MPSTPDDMRHEIWIDLQFGAGGIWDRLNWNRKIEAREFLENLGHALDYLLAIGVHRDRFLNGIAGFPSQRRDALLTLLDGSDCLEAEDFATGLACLDAGF